MASHAFSFLPLPSVSVSSFQLCLYLSLSTEQGQLENIPCAFLAQTRHSPGPLIKHIPSPFLSFSFILSLSLSLSALSPLSPSASYKLSLSTLQPSFFPATSFHHFNRNSLFSRLSPVQSSLTSLPICHGGGLIFTLGQPSESICTKHRACYSLLLALGMCPVTSAM